MKKVINFSVGIVAFFMLCVFFGAYTTINPGYCGIIFNSVTGNLRSVSQGMAFKIPFITSVRSYPISLRTYTIVQKDKDGDDSLDLPTKEGQHIKQDLSITYNTSIENAPKVFRNFKGADIEDIENTFIRRTVITAAQNMAGQMSLTDIISSDRTKLQNAIINDLSIQLSKMGFILDTVNLGASHLPEAIEEQMQQKMGAQQKAQQAEYELQKQTVLAQAAVAEAKGKAQSMLVQAEAQAKANDLLQRSLTPMLIENKKIEKWNGTVPNITSGAIPFINLTNK